MGLVAPISVLMLYILAVDIARTNSVSTCYFFSRVKMPILHNRTHTYGWQIAPFHRFYYSINIFCTFSAPYQTKKIWMSTSHGEVSPNFFCVFIHSFIRCTQCSSSLLPIQLEYISALFSHGFATPQSMCDHKIAHAGMSSIYIEIRLNFALAKNDFRRRSQICHRVYEYIPWKLL